MSRIWLLLLLVATTCCSGNVRQKRYVAFRKGSTFFYRLNWKVNVVPYTTIFAQASGFKVGWELPQQGNSGGGRCLTSQDVGEAARLLYDSHGLDGEMCLMKSLCQALDLIQHKDGVLGRVLKLISGLQGGNGTEALVCRDYGNQCPLHLIGLDGFAEH